MDVDVLGAGAFIFFLIEKIFFKNAFALGNNRLVGNLGLVKDPMVSNPNAVNTPMV